MAHSKKQNQPSPGCKTSSTDRADPPSHENQPVVASEYFQQWFHGSRVVDGNGQPLAMYQGTQTSVADNPDPGVLSDHAICFSSDPEAASFFVLHQGHLVDSFLNAIPVYLSIKNPRVIEGHEIESLFGAPGERQWEATSKVVRQTRESGFDGIHLIGMPEETGAVYDHWLAFDDAQIIAALGPRQVLEPQYAAPVLPIIGYHGTDEDFTDFTPSPGGSFGPGVYFTGADCEASSYGDRVVAMSIELKNPWRVNADYDTDLAEAEDFDSPSVDAVLSLPGGRALLDQAKMTRDGRYCQPLQDLLKRLGHDGIVATYPDGCQEIVAYSSEQLAPAALILNLSPSLFSAYPDEGPSP